MHEIRFFLMIRPPPSSTLTDTLFPDTTLFRSDLAVRQAPGGVPEDLDLSLGEQLTRPRSRELPESTEVRAGAQRQADPARRVDLERGGLPLAQRQARGGERCPGPGGLPGDPAPTGKAQTRKSVGQNVEN